MALQPLHFGARAVSMEPQGLTAKDLEPRICRSNRVCEILAGKRNLTLSGVFDSLPRVGGARAGV